MQEGMTTRGSRRDVQWPLRLKEQFGKPAAAGLKPGWVSVLLVLLVIDLGGIAVQAQYEPFRLLPAAPGHRRQLWEFYGMGRFWGADDVSFGRLTSLDPDGNLITADATLELEDTGMGGFGLGFNINDHWSLNGEFMFGSSDYRAEWGDYELRGEMWMTSGMFNVEYNILSGPFTPFVKGGLGFYYFDTGIPSGPPEWVCWWDSWWGFVCQGFAQTHTETSFAMNAGAGLRWDINDRFFLKALGGATWVDMSSGADWPMFVEASLALGIKL